MRQFNEDGIEAFRQFLSRSRQDPHQAIPPQLLEDDRMTDILIPELKIDGNHFETKLDAAVYLTEILKPLSEQDVSENAKLWTWLTLFFFDEVCPRKSGRRSVKNDYHYIFEPKNSRHFYRHLLFISWQAFRIAPRHHRLILCSKLSTLDKFTTEIMKKLYLTRIPCIFEVLDRLYWDQVKDRPRSGIVGTRLEKPGDLTNRLPLRIRQLEMTYDLLSLNADQLIELLGAEFQQLQFDAVGD